MTHLLASNIMEDFGIHTDIFIAHTIAFIIMVTVVVKFGIKPVMSILEERRQRIEEGEAMHAQSQKELAEVKESSAKILDEARESGKKELEHAKQTAAKLQQELSDKASAEARTVIENAHKQAALDAQKEKDALKGEFTRLVAAATAQVTGKVLTEDDHRKINEEAIKAL